MKALAILLTLSLVANFSLLFFLYDQSRVVAVPDGDSIGLKSGLRVRLLGVNAPELGACKSVEAKEALRRMVYGKHVRLKDTLTDEYGRVLSIVIVEDFPVWISYLWHRATGTPLNPDPLVNRAMLSLGLAKYTFSAPANYRATLRAATDRARAMGAGIYMCRTGATADCIIKGNVRAGVKSYFLPACKYYSQVIVDEAYGDHWFCTEPEASAAGFVFAAACR